MRFTRPRLLLPALLLLACAPAIAQEQAHAGHGGDCGTFRWNVDNELALLASEATGLAAGDGSAEVRIEPGVLYMAQLRPQAEVKLASRPGKPMLDDDAMAGLLTFRVPADGRYRVSITSGHWLDVVDGGEVVQSLDFQGRHSCPLVHKIVLFDLKAGRDLVVQLAGGNAAKVGVLVTPAPVE